MRAGTLWAACVGGLLAAGCGAPPIDPPDAGARDAAQPGLDASHGLVLEPSSPETQECALDFDFVQTNAQAAAAVVFKNLGSQDVDVLTIALEQDSELGRAFAVEGATPVSLTVQPGKTATLPLSFVPTLLGGYEGKLTFETTDLELPSGSCVLWGTGGGPVLEVDPSGPIELGPVNGSVTGQISLANLGTQVTGTTDDSLKLAALEADTSCTANAHCPGGFCLRGRCWKERKVEVEMLEGDASELTVKWPPTGYGATGIPAGERIDLEYLFAPVGPGSRKANLRIPSNDPGRPLVVVEITGSGV